MYTVGELGQIFGLSRTALLYYDSIGLLRPSGRTQAGYRRYDEADRARLDRIVAFRSLGIRLAAIGPLLDLPEEGRVGTLLKRLLDINADIAALRAQQRGILELLESIGALRRGRGRMHELAQLGREVGIDERSYRGVHAALERDSPQEHRRLLSALGFSDTEIAEFLADLSSGP